MHAWFSIFACLMICAINTLYSIVSGQNIDETFQTTARIQFMKMSSGPKYNMFTLKRLRFPLALYNHTSQTAKLITTVNLYWSIWQSFESENYAFCPSQTTISRNMPQEKYKDYKNFTWSKTISSPRTVFSSSKPISATYTPALALLV